MQIKMELTSYSSAEIYVALSNKNEPKNVTKKLDNAFTLQTLAYLWELLEIKLNNPGPKRVVKGW